MTDAENLLYRALALLESQETKRKNGEKCPCCGRTTLASNRGKHHPSCEHRSLLWALRDYQKEVNEKYAAMHHEEDYDDNY